MPRFRIAGFQVDDVHSPLPADYAVDRARVSPRLIRDGQFHPLDFALRSITEIAPRIDVPTNPLIESGVVQCTIVAQGARLMYVAAQVARLRSEPASINQPGSGEYASHVWHELAVESVDVRQRIES